MKYNKICLIKSHISKSSVYVSGTENIIASENALIESCQIYIQGTSNELKISKNVKLRKTIIHIRGSNCKIIIGNNTSFGQVRIVNAGENNNIKIGEDCMFADNIEIWASDTHTIYDKNKHFINPERPITIGNKVWVGSHVKILKGVSINDGAIIGMNSLVTKNLKANTIYAGNPLREIKSDITWSSYYRGL